GRAVRDRRPGRVRVGVRRAPGARRRRPGGRDCRPGMRLMPEWTVHLPAGVDPSDVDLAEGGTLPGAWTAAWAADPKRAALSTLDGARVTADELAGRTAAAAGRYAAAGLAPGDAILLSAAPS